MKIKYVITVFLLILCSCSPFPECPEGSRVIARNEFQRLVTPDSSYWSIVSLSDLSNYCRKRDLCYVGTYENFHLIQWFDKIHWVSEDEKIKNSEDQFAVSSKYFKPDTVIKYPTFGRWIFPIDY
jgi:hypothetical protein